MISLLLTSHSNGRNWKEFPLTKIRKKKMMRTLMLLLNTTLEDLARETEQ